MSAILQTFFAYPSSPDIVGATVEHALQNLRDRSGVTAVQSWRQSDIAGRFVAEQVLNKIVDVPAFAGDITQLNFNVTYEIAFALAKGKRVVLTQHEGIRARDPLISDVGLFDTLG